MDYKIVYIQKQPTWEGKPGRLFTPVPRDVDEAAEAIRTILSKGDVEQITIIPVTEQSR